MDVDPAAVELYGLAPEEFVAARNQLAKTASDHGDARSSAALKALRKPTLAAWLANQLVRSDPDGVNDLTALGEELRAAHLSSDRATLRRLSPRRHDLVRTLVKPPKRTRPPRDAGSATRSPSGWPRPWTRL